MSDAGWLILDTHIWIWWVKQDNQLPAAIKKRLTESPAALAISSASIYEAILQIQRGRVTIDLPLDEWLQAATAEADIAVLTVNADIAAKGATLPLYHGDPLDRIIIATAIHHDAQLASIDSKFPAYEALNGRLILG
jgi:PIN domain nuclease of toxin-antitoxin system